VIFLSLSHLPAILKFGVEGLLFRPFSCMTADDFACFLSCHAADFFLVEVENFLGMVFFGPLSMSPKISPVEDSNYFRNMLKSSMRKITTTLATTIIFAFILMLIASVLSAFLLSVPHREHSHWSEGEASSVSVLSL